MAGEKTIIGLEAHIHLATKSKMFCSCPTEAGEPNSAVCEVCLGMPGSKPVVNKQALDFALKLALALNCEINREFFFSRKTYFYPDMAKNYQISQFEIPVGKNGFVGLKSGKKIRVRRVHLEEDPAALVHESGMHASQHCLVDYNRAGIPMVEIVTEPDIESPKEARDYLDALLSLLQYLEIFVLGEDVLKVDSNVSLEGGERVEVKNITGFRAVEKAIAFETERQRKIVAEGGTVARETRGFDAVAGKTRSLRGKETEEDYGYIFDPDLVKIVVDDSWLDGIRRTLPELPDAKARRFVKEFGIGEAEASVLCSDFSLASLFEGTAKIVSASLAARFLSRELLAIVHHDSLDLKQLNLDAKEIVSLLRLLESGKVSEKNAKEAMIKYVNEKISPAAFLRQQGLLKDIGEKDLEETVLRVLSENKKAVEDLKKGEKKALNFLVGLVMRQTKGKAEPRAIQKLIEEKAK